MLQAAADQGHAGACERLAAFSAGGIDQIQSWPTAIAWLERAAQLGSSSAKTQLALITAGPDALGAGSSPAEAVASWLQQADRESLSERPRIRRFTAFLSAAVCAWLVARARGRLQPACVYDPDSAQGITNGHRTNSEADFDVLDRDVVTELVRARIAVTARVPVAVLEPPKVLHYHPEQRFDAHFDYIEPTTPALRKELACRGQRIATALIALNEDYSGGQTTFPTLDIAWKGHTGDALLFANVAADGRPDSQTLHIGSPVQHGEKWLFSQWIRDRSPQYQCGEV